MKRKLEECQLQYGFRKGKSTEDAINKLCTKTDNLKADECWYVLTIFVDIKGAFDNQWWPALLQQLKKLNIHPHLWKQIKNYFNNRKIEANDADVLRLKYQRGDACRVFWDIAFQPCLKELNIKSETECVVGYA